MANSESSTGLPLDAASLMSMVLEGILYGEYRNRLHHGSCGYKALKNFQAFQYSCLLALCGYSPTNVACGMSIDLRLRLPPCCSYWVLRLASRRLQTMWFAEVSEAHGRKHNSRWKRTGKVSRHVSRRSSGVFRRPSSRIICGEKCDTCFGNAARRWNCGGFMFFNLPAWNPRGWYIDIPWLIKIYRCYIVWQSVQVIILPCIMWCGVAG